MLKIKVMLDKNAYNDLLNDMESYFIFKNDKTINKNKFMNILFKNYYEEYDKKEELIKQKLLNYFEKNNLSYSNLNIDELSYKLINNYDLKDTYFTKGITFNLNFEEEFIFKSLNNLKYESASLYFRNLIYDYLSLKPYLRENIIYKDNLLKINNAILNKKIIKLQIDNKEFNFMPYKLHNTLDDKYTYLIGLNENKMPYSVNIGKINNIFILKENYQLLIDEINMLENIINTNIEYIKTEDIITKIKLTDLGIKLYENNYYNRPKYFKRVGNIFYFNSSTNQLFDYFLPFGRKCKILENDKLKKMILNECKYILRH